MPLPELAVKSSGHGGRGYKHPHTGRVVPSVTTVGNVAEKPGLRQWAVDQTAAFAVANIDSLLTRSDEQAYGFLRWYHKRNPLPITEEIDVRNFHVGVLDDAAELGTNLHEVVEADVNGITRPEIGDDPRLIQMVQKWNEYSAMQFIEPVLTEATVWNETYGYAGTLDGLWWINGRLTLIDIKTARNTWPEHHMQLAALLNAETLLTKNADGEWFEDEWDLSKKFEAGELDVKILHVRPDDIDSKGNDVPAFCELKDMSEDLDLYFDEYIGLLSSLWAKRKRTDREIARRKTS